MAYNIELYHHGVKGQRWGVRRYQNKDGSLTKAGRRRREVEMSPDAKEADRIKKKKVSEMSNTELKRLNERRQLEENYSRLNKSKIVKGMAVAGTIATATSTALTIYNNSDKLVKIGKTACDLMLKR